MLDYTVQLPLKFDWILGASTSLGPGSSVGILAAKNLPLTSLDHSNVYSQVEVSPLKLHSYLTSQAMSLTIVLPEYTVFSGPGYAQALGVIPPEFWMPGG